MSQNEVDKVRCTDSPVIDNPWTLLRRFTDARIALGRAGVSLPTAPQLEFQLAHARARDAVHQALEQGALVEKLSASSDCGGTGLQCISLQSAAPNRQVYLQRPDFGRRLAPDCRKDLVTFMSEHSSGNGDYDLAFVVADGLSSLAIERHAVNFLRCILARLALDAWSVAPITVVTQGRVAIGDEIGELLQARCVVVLIGERPGLSSPDSMGLYMTWRPSVGLTDASRNCISNVRPAGLSYEEAAYKLHFLLSESRRRHISGVDLKDETENSAGAEAARHANFLLG